MHREVNTLILVISLGAVWLNTNLIIIICSKVKIQSDLFLFQSYCLPTINGKHQDLKAISSETLSKVMDGEYSHEIEQAIVVDCRYPYEFQGGHIQVNETAAL